MKSPQPPKLPTWLQVLGTLVLLFVVVLFIIAAAESLG